MQSRLGSETSLVKHPNWFKVSSFFSLSKTRLTRQEVDFLKFFFFFFPRRLNGRHKDVRAPPVAQSAHPLDFFKAKKKP